MPQANDFMTAHSKFAGSPPYTLKQRSERRVRAIYRLCMSYVGMLNISVHDIKDIHMVDSPQSTAHSSLLP